MILRIFEPDHFNRSYSFWKADLSEALINENDLRRKFDKCTLDSQARACIDTAKELGYAELAREMENDLQTELI